MGPRLRDSRVSTVTSVFQTFVISSLFDKESNRSCHEPVRRPQRGALLPPRDGLQTAEGAQEQARPRDRRRPEVRLQDRLQQRRRPRVLAAARAHVLRGRPRGWLGGRLL